MQARPSPAARSFAVKLGVLVAAGVAARVAFVLWTPRELKGDPFFYHFAGRAIAEGLGYVSLRSFFGGTLAPTAQHPPLFPLFLAGLTKLGAGGVEAQRLAVSSLAGGAVIVALGLLGRKLGGSRVGLLAGAIAAFHPMLIAVDSSALSVPLYGVWVSFALLATYALLYRPSASRAAVLGVLIGLATLTRSEALLLLPMLAVPLARRGGPGTWRRLAIACAATVLVLAPWLARNYSLFHRPVLANNYGEGIAGTNCHQSYHGEEIGAFWFACFKVDFRADEIDWTDRMRQQGLDYARDHAGRLLLVLPVRVLRGWGLWQPERQLDSYGAPPRVIKPFAIGGFYLLALAGGLGLVLLSRRRVAIFPLLIPVVLGTLTFLGAGGQPRYRHGAELALIVPAAVVADEALRRFARALRLDARRPMIPSRNE
jgi:4-amino-4-deoxy-L-arabinose transferase-like glycosyltransferase